MKPFLPARGVATSTTDATAATELPFTLDDPQVSAVALTTSQSRLALTVEGTRPPIQPSKQGWKCQFAPKPVAPIIRQPSPPQEKSTEQAAAWLQRYLKLADILLNGKPDGGKQATEDNP